MVPSVLEKCQEPPTNATASHPTKNKASYTNIAGNKIISVSIGNSTLANHLQTRTSTSDNTEYFYSPSVDLYRYGISHTIVQKSVQGIYHNTTSKVYIDT